MVISSLVIETIEGTTEAVAKALVEVDPGVEVHEIVDYKVVVTIEAETLDDSHAIASKFIPLEGVIGVNLIYANFEDDPSLDRGGRGEGQA